MLGKDISKPTKGTGFSPSLKRSYGTVSLLAEGGPHAPPTGELLGYFLVAMGLFYRKKHANIEITGLRGTYFKHF